MTAIIQQLNLEAHIEGGFYRQTYESKATIETRNGTRPLMNCIYYLLTRSSPICHFHRIESDITHFYHLGGPVQYLLISNKGELSRITVGPDFNSGQVLSFTAPGRYWISSLLDDKAEFCLVSEVVTPGFDFADHQMATHEIFSRDFPLIYDEMERFILK